MACPCLTKTNFVMPTCSYMEGPSTRQNVFLLARWLGFAKGQNGEPTAH
jgi:hypothetical protein